MPDTKDIEEFQQMVMEGCDANGDGKINKKELTTVLLALAKYASEEERQSKTGDPWCNTLASSYVDDLFCRMFLSQFVQTTNVTIIYH